ncbi:GNAT family N-acetyltransferase [Reinekea marinisedimentorum]|uniref:Acetyltransferase (GNAT) family protein n=1 Tax=Reinekea marinisedimentorum TaxID=230495 RepID=A0A4R3I5Z2_9GAMM|nr:GNAT family N-acetyltransferase [Reinekea marinisedimentorum]TCS40187.1 Acetyltransferase (GNAT) family protein [Reinekea marinisedimentorum]
MYRIVNVQEYQGGVEQGAQYIHSKWGNKTNLSFYLNAVAHAFLLENRIPKFFLLLHEAEGSTEIAGCYGLIANDFISRHDLMPWFACLFIEKDHRGSRLSERMFSHAKQQAAAAGFAHLYLTTDHDGLYEKFGWQRLEDGFAPSGERTRIYRLATA